MSFSCDWCPVCHGQIATPHDHKPDLSGLDDGPYLPGREPRKTLPPKSADENARIGAARWATRRLKYGQHGHR